jgi:hypothetical protein
MHLLRRHPRQLVVLLPVLGALLLMAASLADPFLGAPEALAQERPRTLRQWKKMMNGWAREIGQKCTYCHVKDGEEFDYEAETPKRKIAHYCYENFVKELYTANKKAVSCGTCHKKKATFLPREGEGGQDAGGKK